MPNRTAALAPLAILALLPGTAAAKVLHSPDGLAPPGAPAHWLPPEPWIYNHWLPYDERRLYRVLHITREDLWDQLRDDHRTLAQLAARHGWRSPRRLAAVLVAGRAPHGGVGRAELERRAVRTITQGHLAQHLFFHSLHQFAIPSAAPDIFGVTDAAFRALRRRELSPLAIGRLHGRSPASVEATSIAVLRGRVRAGVRSGAMSAAQGRLLLRRQLTQLPRWLDQARYNGPPLTHRGALVAAPRDYASNPAISRDGRFVTYEAYRQKLPVAVKLGEIAVLRTDVATGATDLVSGVDPGNPISDYNPAISGDGGLVAYESSPGNNNFAKRYGRIGTMLCDVAGHTTTAADEADPTTVDSQSAYNPALAADGGRLVFEAVRGGRTTILARDLPGGAIRPVVAGVAAGSGRFADPYEPGISADGARVVFTRTSGRVGSPASARSAVLVRDLATHRTLVASAGAPRLAADPAISPDGRWVAFTAAPRGGRPALFLRDLDAARAVAIPTGAALPLAPSVADGGTVVTFTAVTGGRAEIRAWRAATRAVETVSRVSGADGPAADGWSEDSSVSGDGRRVAFASTAANLGAGGAKAIFVRDLGDMTTRLVSDVAVAYGSTR